MCDDICDEECVGFHDELCDYIYNELRDDIIYDMLCVSICGEVYDVTCDEVYSVIWNELSEDSSHEVCNVSYDERHKDISNELCDDNNDKASDDVWHDIGTDICDELLADFSVGAKPLCFLALNVFGVLSKSRYPDFVSLINQYDVVAVSESKLSDADEVQIAGYTAFYKNRDRFIARSGGLLLLVKEHIAKFVTVFETITNKHKIDNTHMPNYSDRQHTYAKLL
eukprot:TRINITY_DN23701_c0_g1_i2.p1 TRINITY_DN23701_c0_g1~~TRINITY_DN23701_c0_g1_i2.p1  ORF type:complete len:225 (-),score=19.75 TRINITY_DN23701_c0_g1_i2:6-680(-)